MNRNIALLAIIEIVASISVGVFILFVTYKILSWFGRTKHGIEEENTAYNIFIANVLFSIGYVITGVIQPIITSFRLITNTTTDVAPIISQFLLYSTIYVVISYSISLMITFLGVKIYSWLTPLDEFNELKNNNVGVGIIIGSIIIVLTLMSKSGIILLIEAIVPYPEMPTFN